MREREREKETENAKSRTREIEAIFYSFSFLLDSKIASVVIFILPECSVSVLFSSLLFCFVPLLITYCMSASMKLIPSVCQRHVGFRFSFLFFSYLFSWLFSFQLSFQLSYDT